MDMLPSWVMVLAPLIFLAASFAWTNEWMLDQAGPGKWLKLVGASLVVPLGALLAGYATDRVVSVPALEPAQECATLRHSHVGEHPGEQVRRALPPGRACDHPTSGRELNKAMNKDWGDMPAEVKAWCPENAKASRTDSPGRGETPLSVRVC